MPTDVKDNLLEYTPPPCPYCGGESIFAQSELKNPVKYMGRVSCTVCKIAIHAQDDTLFGVIYKLGSLWELRSVNYTVPQIMISQQFCKDVLFLIGAIQELYQQTEMDASTRFYFETTINRIRLVLDLAKDEL